MDVLDLSTAQKLGSGNERICFIYPGKDNLCVKVNRPGIIHRSQNKIEYYYFTKLQSRKVPFTHIPEFYGKIETNLGVGLVFERIKKSVNIATERLDLAIEKKTITKSEAQELLSTLYNYLYINGIYVGDLNKDQILLKSIDGSVIPVIIDGLGTRRYGLKLFLISNFRFLARRKLKKSWPTLIKKLTL